MDYQLLIKNNKNLEYLKWSQYFNYYGKFTIDNIEIYGELTNEEIENVNSYLHDKDNLLSTFGSQVTVKVSKNGCLQIEENLFN
jgi:hypothetical protein